MQRRSERDGSAQDSRGRRHGEQQFTKEKAWDKGATSRAETMESLGRAGGIWAGYHKCLCLGGDVDAHNAPLESRRA